MIKLSKFIFFLQSNLEIELKSLNFHNLIIIASCEKEKHYFNLTD